MLGEIEDAVSYFIDSKEKSKTPRRKKATLSQIESQHARIKKAKKQQSFLPYYLRSTENRAAWIYMVLRLWKNKENETIGFPSPIASQIMAHLVIPELKGNCVGIRKHDTPNDVLIRIRDITSKLSKIPIATPYRCPTKENNGLLDLIKWTFEKKLQRSKKKVKKLFNYIFINEKCHWIKEVDEEVQHVENKKKRKREGLPMEEEDIFFKNIFIEEEYEQKCYICNTLKLLESKIRCKYHPEVCHYTSKEL